MLFFNESFQYVVLLFHWISRCYSSNNFIQKKPKVFSKRYNLIYFLLEQLEQRKCFKAILWTKLFSIDERNNKDRNSIVFYVFRSREKTPCHRSEAKRISQISSIQRKMKKERPILTTNHGGKSILETIKESFPQARRIFPRRGRCSWFPPFFINISSIADVAEPHLGGSARTWRVRSLKTCGGLGVEGGSADARGAPRPQMNFFRANESSSALDAAAYT